MSWQEEQKKVATGVTGKQEPKRERNFCERCGKRLFDGIHTCAPPPTGTYLYSHPAKQITKKELLTKDKLYSIYRKCSEVVYPQPNWESFARAIEKAHGIGE